MIRIFILLTASFSLSFSQRMGPCDSLWNIYYCVCDDAGESEVRFPPLCRSWGFGLDHCICNDGSEWLPPPPPGLCKDGTHDIETCDYVEKTGSVMCLCEDETSLEFVPKRSRGGIRGRGGNRGGFYGRGRGRGSFIG